MRSIYSRPGPVRHPYGSLQARMLFLLQALLLATPLAAQDRTLLALRYEGDCNLIDDKVQLRTLEVLHTLNNGTIGSRFKLVADPGVTATYVSETVHTGTAAGNTQDGITLCYGFCSGGTLLLVSVNYMAFGTSDYCSQIRIVPHPEAETVDAIRCDYIPVGTYVEDLVLGNCGCPSTHVFPGVPELFGCGPTPVRATTWGAIKALYVN